MRISRIKPVVALLSGLVAVAATGCSTGFIESPPTNVTPTGATLIGKVGSDRSESGIWWYEYGTSTAYGKATPQRTITFSKNVKLPVSETVSGLTAATEYHYRLCAKDQDPNTGAHCSGDAKFTTAGTDRPRYQLHIDSADGSSSYPQSGVAELTIDVDGDVVDHTKPGCASQNCTLSRDWTLNTTNYAPGPHTITVASTDEVGRTTSRKLNIEIQRDTTDPALTVSGPLKTAPEGWVDQHDYTVTGKATDSGYGATSLKLLVDDNQVGQAATQPCPDGGCSLDHTFTVNTANYSGGAHDVKLVATDGAGNDTTSSWTVNVNPDGQIPASEAAATVRAADSTADTTVVAPTSEAISPEEISAGNNPALQQTGITLQSTGTPVTSTMTTNPGDGFTLSSPKDSIKITPIGTSGAATSSAVTSGAAAVSGDTASQVDTVVRPVYNGAMTFESIRDATAPEAFSWRVELDADQHLTQVDDQTAEVYWSDDTPAMMISAQPAHDATGATVPTKLATSGTNVITLTVSHRGASFVYPVLAGPGWQAAYIYVNPFSSADPIIATDTDPGDSISYTDVDAPVLDRSTGESGWKRLHAVVHECFGYGCWWDKVVVSGYFRYNGHQALRKTVDHPGIGCQASGAGGKVDPVSFGHGRGWAGPNPAYDHGDHSDWLIMYCNYRVGIEGPLGVCFKCVDWHLQGKLFPSGWYNPNMTAELGFR